MSVAILVWQAIIFFSIALSGRHRDGVTGFWIIWTLLQVFALWLSVLQFGTIWLAWSIFREKDSSKPLANAPQKRPALPLIPDPAQRAAFDAAFKQWSAVIAGSLSASRWIPKSAASELAARFSPPVPSGQSWKQATGDATPLVTLGRHIDASNVAHLRAQKIARKPFFDSVEKNALTDEQIHACICMDDNIIIVAAAGSGKTSTMVAKTGYVLHEGLAKPEQILLLSFNRSTAEEVGDRIAEQLRSVPDVERVRSKTFHAFGIEVIGAATGKKPSLAPWLDPANAGGDVRELADIVESLCRQDPAFRQDWALFRTIFGRDVGRLAQRHEPDAYDQGKRGFLTAGGEVVRSKEERLIADWLFYNGVLYVYERAYEHDTADETHRQYQPDFYYPDANLYHEHFSLNADGKAPAEFGDYLSSVRWKREIHAAMGTALVETTSHALMNGEGFEALTRALIDRGVTPRFDPTRQAVGLAPVEDEDLARSFRVFQQHVKNNGLSQQDLLKALAEQSEGGFGERLRRYLSLYERISAEWEVRLRAARCIDFEDMLTQAASLVESGSYKSPYKVILADEFQDSSRARIRLLKALVGNAEMKTHLCVVGDDWQGINRFAGADISVMNEFAKHFAPATRLSLNTTFRCPKHLCDVSSEFIQANPAQIRKTVRTVNPLTKTPLLAYGFQSAQAICGYVERQLVDMHRYASEGKLKAASSRHITILLLGRYHRDRPAQLKDWTQRFGDHLRIEFRTAHAAKGAEAEYVFVLNVIQGTQGFPSQIQDDPALQLAMIAPDPYPFAEERRLFYVAMTRARKQVRFYTTLAQPSQFLVELIKNEHLSLQPVDGDVVTPCVRPECGGVMVSRGRGLFQGCSRFPACDQTRSLDTPRSRTSQRIKGRIEAGQPCPICRQGLMRSRNGRNGPFLGCSRYRDGCRATANFNQI